MATKKEETAPELKKQPKASEAKKVTKKTESAAEIDVVQSKKTMTIKRKSTAASSKVKKTKIVKSKKVKSRDIGVDIDPPTRGCDDPNCPFHGNLPVRGFSIDVQLVSNKMDRTVVVMRERRHTIQKYQRYEKRSSRYLAHMPPCLDAEVGDMVRIMECRPISKGTTKVVIGRI